MNRKTEIATWTHSMPLGLGGGLGFVTQILPSLALTDGGPGKLTVSGYCHVVSL